MVKGNKIFMLVGVLWMLGIPPVQAQRPDHSSELIFKDDFERTELSGDDQQWYMTRMSGVGCGRVNPASRPVQEQGQAILQPPVQIRDGQLLLSEASSGAPVQAYRVINRPVRRIGFEFTPLNVMGGMDDRAWVGARIQFMDRNNGLLGELWYYFYNRHYERPSNTSTRYAVAVKGAFDGVKRRLSIEVEELIRRYLKGVDPDQIARTLVIFELGAGWCGSEVAGTFDNVEVFAGRSEEYTLTQQEVLAIGRSVMPSFLRDHAYFPENWIRRVRAKYQAKRVDRWLDAIERHMQAHPTGFVPLVERMTGVSDNQIPQTAFAVRVMVDNRKLPGLDDPVQGPMTRIEEGEPTTIDLNAER
ncbi:hypothetical protein Mmc1_0339 [Magnetococcus marinus MC-1]|uniref:Glycosyl transferase family 51 domain-containing protein n=1 Tax=Magnetococcus marinus (strain ATCC BAA-1437 / JCM 17883 / MC-1) TaxID=156889 RepID=A0L4H2_MAGMM|nr:hypothetical protein [Magnetococcus marinus]ABK42865.1 hypothetical protein Mmc1_0339 [Magnetococcus marinus MC-1]